MMYTTQQHASQETAEHAVQSNARYADRAMHRGEIAWAQATACAPVSETSFNTVRGVQCNTLDHSAMSAVAARYRNHTNENMNAFIGLTRQAIHHYVSLCCSDQPDAIHFAHLTYFPALKMACQFDKQRCVNVWHLEQILSQN